MKLGLTPCTWQHQSAHNQLENKDVFTISPTGSGKTLTFWIPLLFNNGGITIIITPLNILSEKNRDEANAYGFPALDICAEIATDEALKRSPCPSSDKSVTSVRSMSRTIVIAHCVTCE
jgi:superfamily II DNA helicase RecQ